MGGNRAARPTCKFQASTVLYKLENCRHTSAKATAIAKHIAFCIFDFNVALHRKRIPQAPAQTRSLALRSLTEPPELFCTSNMRTSVTSVLLLATRIVVALPGNLPQRSRPTLHSTIDGYPRCQHLACTATIVATICPCAGVFGQKRGFLFPYDSVAADLSSFDFTKAGCSEVVSYIDWESWTFGTADPSFEFIAMARTQGDVAALATYLPSDRADKIAFLNVGCFCCTCVRYNTQRPCLSRHLASLCLFRCAGTRPRLNVLGCCYRCTDLAPNYCPLQDKQ